MSEQQVSVPTGLSDRAAVALLTLRLRTVEKELLDARAAASAIDVESARHQLRAKLMPLEAKRRAALDEALAQAERDAAVAVEAAHLRAAAITSERPMAPVVIDVASFEEAAQPSTPEAVADAAPVEDELPRVESPSPAPPAHPAVVTAPQIVFDAETFARVFATVIAETIEKTRFELQSQQPTQPMQPMQPIVPPVQYSPGMPMMPGAPGGQFGQYPMYYMPPQAQQQGFWSHAKHPDVFLLGIATTIVMTILVAWLS